MGFNTKTVTGITHDVHVEHDNGKIESYEGVLDVMKLPDGTVKFKHKNELKQVTNGTVIRSRVNNVDDAHKYVCHDCESDEGALITATDYGEMLELTCGNCGATGLTKKEL